MSQLSLTLLRLGFLVLLWALVLFAIGVLRADIYGTRILTRGRGLTRKAPPKPVKPKRQSTGITAPAPTSKLAIVAGPLRGTTVPLASAPVSIGRAPTSTIVLEDDYCSAKHARVYSDSGRWMIEDLGSTNGTYVDDALLDDPIELKQGAVIRLGATEIKMAD